MIRSPTSTPAVPGGLPFDATQIQFTPAGTGAVARSMQDKERDIVSIFDGLTDAQKADVRAGTYSLDVTSVCQAVLNAHSAVRFIDGSYKLTDKLTLNANQDVYIDGGATLKQFTTDKGVFYALQKDRVHIVNNGLLYGPGVWSSGWTGNGGHEERGVQFLGCTRSSVTGVGTIRNFGHAQLALFGGTNIAFKQKCEGTNGYGSALALNDNFQMGVYLADDDTYGILDGIHVDCDISGSAQGILREWRRSDFVNGGTLTIRGNIHDIPGQHATYIQSGNLNANYTVKAIALSGCKISSGAGEVVNDGVCIVTGEDLGSHLFEVSTVGAGSVSNFKLIGTATQVDGYGASLLGKMDNIDVDVAVTNAGGVFQAQGANQTNIRARVSGKTLDSNGIEILSTTSDYKIWPTLRQPNNGAHANTYGISVNSASATVELFDPDVTDSNTRMVYGLFNVTLGSIVKVRGSAKFTGASDTAVRAIGLVTEWPAETTLSGTNGAFTGQALFTTSQPMIVTAQSVSASNVVVWALSLDDESAYMVHSELIGKKSGSAERACYVETALFYRDAAGVATQQGATDTDVSVVSAGFAGAHSLGVDGANGIALLANSGGAATTYDWKARVTVTKLS